jgi:hypothetical protein
MNRPGIPGCRAGFNSASRAVILLLALLSPAPLTSGAEPFDIAPFARRCAGLRL